MNVVVEVINGCAIVQPSEARLDLTNARDFVAVCKDNLDQHSKLVLDLQHVDFMDSSGLGAVITGLKSGASNGTVRICGLRGPVLRLFETARLTRLFVIAESRQEAVEQLGGK